MILAIQVGAGYCFRVKIFNSVNSANLLWLFMGMAHQLTSSTSRPQLRYPIAPSGLCILHREAKEPIIQPADGRQCMYI